MAERRKIHEIWISAELEGDSGVADIVEIAAARRVPLRHVAKGKLEHEARTDAPQGVLAFAAEVPEADLGDLIRGTGKTKPFLVAVDGVTDPGNLGAIIRSCDAAGVTGLLLPRHRSVHITPTVSKASAGAIEYVPMALVPGLPTALKQLKDHGVWTVGLDDDADQDLYDIGKLATDAVCLVLGAEGAGISRLTRERCDTVVSIPDARTCEFAECRGRGGRGVVRGDARPPPISYHAVIEPDRDSLADAGHRPGNPPIGHT